MRAGATTVCVVLALAVIVAGIAASLLGRGGGGIDREQVRRDLVAISLANSAAESHDVPRARALADARCMADRILKDHGVQKAAGSIAVGCLRQQGQTPTRNNCSDPNAPANPVPANPGAYKMTPALVSMCSKYYSTNADVAHSISRCGVDSAAARGFGLCVSK
jgi:hypothetical protein